MFYLYHYNYGYSGDTIIFGMKKKEKDFRNLRLSFCKSARSLPPFRGGKNEHATLTIYRCSSTCWHLKILALAQIDHRTKKPKTNSLFNQLISSRASWLIWKLCAFGSSGTWFEFHRGQHFIFVSLFSESEDSEKFQSLSHVRRWPPHMRASEVYKNLTAGDGLSRV